MAISAKGRRLPPYLFIAAAVFAVILVGAGSLWLTGAQTPGIGGPFHLVNGDDKPVSDKDFRGRYMLVYFGYTFCPDVCPTTLNQVAEAMDKLGPLANKVQPIFITVDPARDTPAAVKQFAAAFSPRLLGLTGSPEQIAQAAKEYRVYYAVHRSGGGSGDYTVDHSSILYLMDKSGRFVAPIRADGSATEIADTIKRYLS